MFIRGTIIKVIFSVGLVVFLLLGSFGVFHMSMSMNMQSDGEVSRCPFSPGVYICTMNPLDMIATLQSMFMSLPGQKDITSFLLLLIVSAIPTFVVFIKIFSPPRLILRDTTFLYREYIPSGFLKELFSSGILNPKIF